MKPPSTPAADATNVPFVRLDRDRPGLFEELMEAVGRVARASAFTLGDEVEGFEAEFAAYCGSEHAVGVSSGTDALSLAFRALGIGPGDEVVVPANSFIATAEAVSLVGGTPRFADVDPDTGLLTAATATPALNERTRCIVPVHLYGRTVQMDPLLALARESGLTVVEDAAQAHGAWYRGRRVGTLGDLAAFSFYPTKNLGAWGDAGAVTTDDPELADRVRLLRSHGERPKSHHRLAGATARLDGLQAAILRVKLSRLDDDNDRRRALASGYRERLTDGALRLLSSEVSEGEDSVHHLFVVCSEDRDELRAHCDGHGVATGVHYPVPIHLTPAYRAGQDGQGFPPLSAAEGLSRTVCSLPVFPTMTIDELDRVADVVRGFRPLESA